MNQKIGKVIRVSLSLLEKKDRNRLIIICFAQLTMSFMDLIGVALIGILSTLSFFGIQSKSYPSSLVSFLRLLNLEKLTFQYQVAAIGLLALTLFISKTIFSSYVIRRIIFYLNIKSTEISRKLLEISLSKSYDFIKIQTPSTFIYSVTRSVDSLIVGVLSASMLVFGELILLIVILIGVFFIDPVVTIASFIYFGITSLFLMKSFGLKSHKLQELSTQESIKSEKRITEILRLYREYFARNALLNQIKRVSDERKQMAVFRAEVYFLPHISKYIMEISLIFGVFLLMAAQFWTKDAVSAVTTLSIFLAAATRVSPAMLRVQQSWLSLKSSSGDAKNSLDLIKANDLRLSNNNLTELNVSVEKRREEKPYISVENLNFKYNDGSELVLNNINFHIAKGKMLAIIGNSGSGKSTLMDILIGVLAPTSGNITIEGYSPKEFILANQTAVSFVAQESNFLDETLRENLLIGLRHEDYSDEKLWNVLDEVGLIKGLNLFEQGLDSLLGDRGSKLSVGQRQRLSIARALLPNPQILFLDEPTSALDHESEKLILQLLEKLRKSTTIIVIAHRLSTIKSADAILLMKNGQIQDFGTYDSLFKSSKIDSLDMSNEIV